MANPNIPEAQKEIIYEAILERVNDPELAARDKSLGGFQLPEVDMSLLLKLTGETQIASGQGLRKAATVLSKPEEAIERLMEQKNGQARATTAK